MEVKNETDTHNENAEYAMKRMSADIKPVMYKQVRAVMAKLFLESEASMVKMGLAMVIQTHLKIKDEE